MEIKLLRLITLFGIALAALVVMLVLAGLAAAVGGAVFRPAEEPEKTELANEEPLPEVARETEEELWGRPRLALTYPEDGLYVLEPGEVDARKISEGQDFFGAAWSPDGERVAYESDDGVWITDADGSDRRRLNTGSTGAHAPTFSPDGRRIAFSDRSHIYVIRTDGTGMEELVRGPQLGEGDLSQATTDPAFSPDGKKVAFSKGCDLYVVNVDGSGEEKLTGREGDEGCETAPDWSPDGGRIAFSGSRGDDADLYVVDADGKNLTRLLNPRSHDSGPSWSPAGDDLLFVGVPRNAGTNGSALYAISLDEGNAQGNLRLVYDGLPNPQSPDW